ncbi:MAG: hypothetical protein CHACPFDD_02697 [Phycisphaerae bacterium]|nr:hypothetical protein [Phycisphaerae bacterium]
MSTRHRAASWSGLLLLAGCGLGSEDGFAPLTPTDNFHVIKAGQAYRSAQIDAQTLRTLIESLQVRTVLNLRGPNEQAAWYQAERDVCAELDVTMIDVAMSARELPSRDTLLALFDALAAAELPLLIHCRAGADRTGAVSAIWRMQVAGDSREAARDELSTAFGHFAFATPEMDALVAMFMPERDWILNDYPVD